MWVPFLNTWPVCSICKTPVEKFSEIEWTLNKDALMLTIHCHGEKQHLVVKPPDSRRLHFPEGQEIHWPSQQKTEKRGRKINL